MSSQTPENTLNTIFNLFSKNITTSLSIITTTTLFAGGFIFFLYFHSIRFTPVLDFESSISILLAAAILGLVLITSLAGILVMPGVVWYSFYESGFIEHNKYKRIKRNFLIWSLIPFSFPIFILVLDIRSNRINFGMYTTLILLLFSLGLGLFLAAVTSQTKEKNLKYERKIEHLLKKKKHKRFFKLSNIINKIVFKSNIFCRNMSREKKQRLSFVFAWLYSIGFGQIIGFPILLILLLFDNGKLQSNSRDILAVLCMVLLSSCISNFCILYFLAQKGSSIKYVKALSAAFLSILLLILPIKGLSFLPSLIMTNFGWGNVSNASVIVDYKGCQVISIANQVKTQCSDGDSSLYRFDNVKVLLNLGDTFYCELDVSSPEQAKKVRLQIPKTHVLSVLRQNSSAID